MKDLIINHSQKATTLVVIGFISNNIHLLFSLNLTIGCTRATELDEETIDWGFKLTKENMQVL